MQLVCLCGSRLFEAYFSLSQNELYRGTKYTKLRAKAICSEQVVAFATAWRFVSDLTRSMQKVLMPAPKRLYFWKCPRLCNHGGETNFEPPPPPLPTHHLAQTLSVPFRPIRLYDVPLKYLSLLPSFPPSISPPPLQLSLNRL